MFLTLAIPPPQLPSLFLSLLSYSFDSGPRPLVDVLVDNNANVKDAWKCEATDANIDCKGHKHIGTQRERL